MFITDLFSFADEIIDSFVFHKLRINWSTWLRSGGAALDPRCLAARPVPGSCQIELYVWSLVFFDDKWLENGWGVELL